MWCKAKYGLFVVNLLFTLTGLALVGINITAVLQLNVALEVIPGAFGALPRIAIILGLLIFFIAFFGCWIREIKYYLILYAVSMLLLAASKVYLATVIFRNLQTMNELVASWLEVAFDNDSLENKFHEIEIAYQCCGTIGPQSYKAILASLPSSCCPEPVEFLLNSNQTCNLANAYKGCNKILSAHCNLYGQAVGLVIVIIIAVELAAMILSVCICQSIKKKQNV